MNVLVAVADPGLRALWEDILPTTATVRSRLWISAEWREAHIVRSSTSRSSSSPPVRPECPRAVPAPAGSRRSRPSLVVPGPAGRRDRDDRRAQDRAPTTSCSAIPTAAPPSSHLAALERRRHRRPALTPTAHELASGSMPRMRGSAPRRARRLPDGRRPLRRRCVEVRTSSRSAAGSACHGPATILLIDDEPHRAPSAAQALQHVGYRVIEASDGEEGLEVIARRGDEIAARRRRPADAPRLRPRGACGRFRRRERRIPVVLMSGYPSLDPPDGPAGPDAFLRKPFELLDLARTVQRLMESGVAQPYRPFTSLSPPYFLPPTFRGGTECIPDLHRSRCLHRPPFAGNPAAVCLLPAPRDEEWMQLVAREMNLAETAFLVRSADGFDLRWFTPTLRGGSLRPRDARERACALGGRHLAGDATARFHTRSGRAHRASRRDGLIWLDFPATPARAADAADDLEARARRPLTFVGQTPFDYLVELDDEDGPLVSLIPIWHRAGPASRSGSHRDRGSATARTLTSFPDSSPPPPACPRIR